MARHLKTYLEYQADRVEAVLGAHKAPGRIIGGLVGPSNITFYLQPAPSVRFATVQRLADDLAMALQVNAVKISLSQQGGVALEFRRPDPQKITLTGLLAEFGPLPIGSAVLGLSSDGTPLSARLGSPEVAHILIAGTTGCGKSNLLRSIAASLLSANSPSALLVLAIDPKGRTFNRGFTCPHLLSDKVLTDPQESVSALSALIRLMEARDKSGEHLPRVAIIIDELADLIMAAGGGVEQALVRLTQRGREAGIHVIAATQRPSAAILSGIMRANFPCRIVGRVASIDDSRIAAGRGGIGAEKLNGRGDFIIIAGQEQIRFQAPLVSHDEMRRLIADNAYNQTATQSLKLPSGGPLNLLEDKPTAQQAVEPDDIEIAAAKLRPWWERNRDRWRAGEWGVQTEAVKVLFPDDPAAANAGYWREVLLRAVSHLERNSTTTQFLPALTRQNPAIAG